MSPALLREKDSSGFGGRGLRSPRPGSRRRRRLGLGRGWGLLARPDTPWLDFLHNQLALSGTENFYRDSLPLLGFRSAARGAAFMNLIRMKGRGGASGPDPRGLPEGCPRTLQVVQKRHSSFHRHF